MSLLLNILTSKLVMNETKFIMFPKLTFPQFYPGKNKIKRDLIFEMENINWHGAYSRKI